MKTAAKLIKSIFRKRSDEKSNFKKVSWLREKILKHQNEQSIKTIKFEHFRLAYKKPYEVLHTYKELFEKEIYRFPSTKPNPLIIDCGANIGLSVLYFKTLFPDAEIFAFEPDKNNFHLLNENVKLNQFNNITLFKEAVWIEAGEISFSSSESEASHISIEENAGSRVKTVRLRSFLEQFDEIDLLKIDIEGAEWNVVRDCKDSLSKVKNFFLEYHGKVNDTDKLTDLLQIVNEARFNVYLKMAADRMHHPFTDKSLNLPYDVQLNIFCYR